MAAGPLLLSDHLCDDLGPAAPATWCPWGACFTLLMRSPMRSSRLLLAVPALCALAALTACSGDSDDDAGASATPTWASSHDGDDDSFTKRCAVQVAITGAEEASWEDRGSVTGGGDSPTRYTTRHDGDRVVVYAGAGDFPTTAKVSVGGSTYPVTDDSGIDAAEDGTSATIDADTAEGGPHVSATFTCGKG